MSIYYNSLLPNYKFRAYLLHFVKVQKNARTGDRSPILQKMIEHVEWPSQVRKVLHQQSSDGCRDFEAYKGHHLTDAHIELLRGITLLLLRFYYIIRCFHDKIRCSRIFKKQFIILRIWKRSRACENHRLTCTKALL